MANRQARGLVRKIKLRIAAQFRWAFAKGGIARSEWATTELPGEGVFTSGQMKALGMTGLQRFVVP